MSAVSQVMKRIIPWIVRLAMLMESIDTTSLNTSLPQIAYSLGEDPIHLKLALTSYLLSLGVFIPISGWMADRFGAKRIFILAMAIFTLSSMGCGQAQTLWQLVSMRILQGLGGAMMTPVGRLILLRVFEKAELAEMWTRMGMMILMGPLIGPSLGGFLTEYLSWRWIFYVNVPLGIIGIFLLHNYLALDFPLLKKRFDFLGFVLCGAGLALLLFACQEFMSDQFSIQLKLGLLALALLLLAAYCLYARFREYPVVNLNLFKIRVFRIAVIGGTISRFGSGAMPFLLPLLFQLGFGYSPLQSGLMLLPMAVGQLTVKSIVKYLLQRYGFRKAVLWNTILLSLVSLQFSWLDSGTSPLILIILLFLYGSLSSMQFSNMNLLAYADMPAPLMSDTTSLYSAIQQIGVSFGIAIAAIILEFYLGSHELIRVIPVAYFHKTFLFVSLLIMSAAWIFSKLEAQDGAAVSGHQI